MFKKRSRARLFGKLQKTDPWPEIFSRYREDVERSFAGSWAELAVERSLIEYFLQPERGALPSKPLELALAFFGSDSQDNLDQRLASREWIWRGGRYNGRCFYGPEVVTDTCFGCALEQLARDSCQTRQDDVSRSLICVLNFTKAHGEDLIRNVAVQGAHALRSAILGHIARSTILRVIIPDEGYTTFCLELHLPFFTVSKHRTALSENGLSDVVAKKPWEDTSFLRADVDDSSGDSCCLIYEVHASISISGSSRFKYKGYSFLDLGYLPADKDDEGEIDHDQYRIDSDVNEENGDNGAGVEDPLVDVFTTHGDGSGPVLDPSERPLDPRAYFLECFKFRSDVARGQYAYLVAHLETELQAWIDRNIMMTHPERQILASKTLTNHDKFKHLMRMKWIIKRIRGEMGKTIQVWTNFNRPSGDKKFFDSLKDQSAANSMRDLTRVFIEIKGLEQRMNRLEKSCEDPLKLLRYQVALNNSALNQHNNDVTDKTLVIHSKATELSTQSTQFASESLKAAESATRMSRVSVCLYLLTTSFISALQYFTSDQNIFALSRTPRMFFVAIGVLIPLFIVVTWLMYFIDGYKTIVFWKLYTWMGGPQQRNKGKPCDTGTAE